MPATPTQARDQILGLLKAALDASAYATIKVAWDDVKTKTPTPTVIEAAAGENESWLRPTITHTGGSQTSLAGALRTKHWTYNGLLTVQVFTPSGEGSNLSDDIVYTVLNGYQGKSTPGSVWFRNARFREIGTSGAWYQVNVLVEFEYYEIK